MINMIKADLYRIFRSKGIYIALFLMIAMLAMSVYSVSPGYVGQMQIGDMNTAQYSSDDAIEEEGVSAEEVHSMNLQEYREAMLKTDFEFDKAILGANMNLYYIFIFVIAIIITADFSGGCIKNTLSSAIDRKKYFLSKTILVFGMGTVVFFLNTYLSYFSNLIFNGKNVSSSLGAVSKITLMQMPPALALMSLLIGIAFLSKKMATYNLISIPFVMVFQMLLASFVLLLGINQKYLNYELQIMFAKLTTEPTREYLLHSYLLCAGIVVLSLMLGWLVFRKAEIK